MQLPVTASVQPADIAAPKRQATALRSVILFDGGVRRSSLLQSIDRSILELPLDSGGTTVLETWRRVLQDVGQRLGIEQLDCRIAVGQTAIAPALATQDNGVRFSVSVDSDDLRGTGGIASDFVRNHPHEDYLLTAAAGQVILQPMDEAIAAALADEAEATVISDMDGSSLIILAARSLRGVAPRGFVDLKEQVLPAVASRGRVAVQRTARRIGMPVRTAGDYLRLLRAWHESQADTAKPEPFAEQWQSRFSVVEAGATVHDSARVHDSVILRDAVVGADAVVAGCVVCPGARVAAGARLAHQLITARGTSSIDDA